MDSLLEEIENRYAEMTAFQRRVAQYVMSNAGHVAFLTLEDLASEVGVSTTSVLRFVRSLGYSGYSEFQGRVQQMVKAKLGLPERLTVSAAQVERDDLLVKSFDHDIANIRQTLVALREQDVEEAVTAISSAANLYVVGLRSSFCVAHFFATVLAQIRDNVRLVHSMGGTLPEEILGAGPGDSCVVFSFPRYTRSTVEVARWVKKQGVKVVGVTDSSLSPISTSADLVLACEVRGLIFKNSLVAVLALVNYLVSAVALRNKDQALRMLAKGEDLLRQWEYFAI